MAVSSVSGASPPPPPPPVAAQRPPTPPPKDRDGDADTKAQEAREAPKPPAGVTQTVGQNLNVTA